MLMRDTNSCPNSPARSAERWEIENDHLKQQISLLQFELDNRRRTFLLAVQEINATHETRARNDEARMMYLKQSNQELAVQVERLTKRSHRDQAKIATTERAVFQLEAQNAWLDAQLKAVLHENTEKTQQNQQYSPHTVVLFRDSSSAPPQLQTKDLSQTTACMNNAGNSLSLSLTLSEDSSLAGMQVHHHQQQQEPCDEDDNAANGGGDGGVDLYGTDINDDTFNNHFSFPIMSSLPLSPAPSMPPPPRRSTYAEAITGTLNNNLKNNKTTTAATTCTKRVIMPTNTTTTTSTTRKRATYGTDPRFLEIRQAYHNVITSQADEEEPLARWVRTVMSNTSAIETDPRKVEPVLFGLKELCEENGISLPLQKVGPCQFHLLGQKNGSGAQRLSVKLINGRLMARSGPAWLDIFKWLERQPLSIEEKERKKERKSGQ